MTWEFVAYPLLFMTGLFVFAFGIAALMSIIITLLDSSE